MENKEKKQMLTTELTKEKSGRSAGMIQDMSINGIKLHLAQNGTGGPVIFWGMYPHQQNEVEHLWESLLELVPEQNFLLVAFQVEDWNRDFSHWLMGYSLAGLFALWAAYESDVFSGIVCCSGSLWFPDWDHYVRNHVIQSKCSVYLSLGGKEEKAKNKVMASVGDRTRAQEGLLQEDSMVESVVLEWNAGGHFADAGKRLAKGVKWMFGVKSGL